MKRCEGKLKKGRGWRRTKLRCGFEQESEEKSEYGSKQAEVRCNEELWFGSGRIELR